MTRFAAEEYLATLTGFQRTTVDHVTARFYGHGARRFMVADETGLGKSLIARGVIARTVEHLQDDDRVDRIDVVYVCSNSDIARQNLSRLRIGGANAHTVASRLTMMAKHSRRLSEATAVAGKPLNLVAFTPGTSFDKGWRTGQAEERVLLFLLLRDQLGLSGWDERAARTLLRGNLSGMDRFLWWERKLATELHGEPDPVIANGFAKLCADVGLDDRFRKLIEQIRRCQSVPTELKSLVHRLTGDLRNALARAGIDTLEPDLIILDEFQRFRHLLSVEAGGDSAELARELFDYDQAKVLLLSATPYKPFTLAEESDTGEDHYRDFFELLRFLRGDDTWRATVDVRLREYRSAMISGRPAASLAAEVRELLLDVMCRTERPALGQDRMLSERVSPASTTTTDLLGYAALRRLATELDSPATVEYWKSAPYFVNFMDGYILGDTLRAALRDPARRERLTPLIAATQRLNRDDIRHFHPVDAGNGRLRELMAATVASGQPRLLWLPPSLPYHQLDTPFTDIETTRLTKRLVFSSWNATPTAVAALISYEAERQLLAGVIENSPEGRRRLASRLDYRLDGDRPAAMTTLALFWPHPGLAEALDPLAIARHQPDRVLEVDRLHQYAVRTVLDAAPPSLAGPDHRGETSPAHAYLRWPDALPFPARPTHLVPALTGGIDNEEDAESHTGLSSHVHAAIGITGSTATTARSARDLAADLAALGMYGPGTISWRALHRLITPEDSVTPEGHWTAAAIVSSGLRALFNRPESIALLDHLYGDEPYWRKVLRYSAAGCLQAVMDEYLHQLRISESIGPLDDTLLTELATRARQALTLRVAPYQAFDPEHPEQRIGFPSRFAVRYNTDARAGDARPGDVRGAFNSPFWPLVLTTTSAGQEGIDFHWWSHAVVHWNTPANPVDLEQREGRVHRYGGHAIRKNIASQHRAAILSDPEQDPWRAAFRIATAQAGELGEFAPYWLYPGDATVERHLLPYTLSRDIAKTTRLKESLALYRLAFGQPRQEDFLDLIRQRGGTASDQPAINLRPTNRDP